MQEIEGVDRFLFEGHDNGLKNRAILVFSVRQSDFLFTENVDTKGIYIEFAFMGRINSKDSPSSSSSNIKIERQLLTFNNRYPGLSPNICKERAPMVPTFDMDPSAPPRSALVPEIKTNSFNIHGKKQTRFRQPVNGNNRKDCHGKQKSNAQQRRWFAQKGK